LQRRGSDWGRTGHPRGADALHINTEAVEHDAYKNEKGHKPGSDPFQGMLMPLLLFVRHDDAPALRYVSAISAKFCHCPAILSQFSL
jgi:hypothetical protein